MRGACARDFTLQHGKVNFRASGGFTLFELVLVMGLIVAIVGGIGFVGMRSDHRVQLNAGARQIAMLLAQARDQAQLKQARTRLLVDASTSLTDSLSVLWLVQWQQGRWVLLGDAHALPEGVAVVPHLGEGTGAFDGREGTSVFSSDGAVMELALGLQEIREFTYIEFRADGRTHGWETQDYLESDVQLESLQLTLSPCAWVDGLSKDFVRPERWRTLRIQPSGEIVWIADG
ncbi:MAG: hypothetical protein ABQ298_15310 [Puniceicoccaceae bacterium]